MMLCCQQLSRRVVRRAYDALSSTSPVTTKKVHPTKEIFKVYLHILHIQPFYLFKKKSTTIFSAVCHFTDQAETRLQNNNKRNATCQRFYFDGQKLSVILVSNC